MSGKISEGDKERAFKYFEKHAKYDKSGDFYRVLRPYNVRKEYVANDTSTLFKILLKNWKEDTNDGICDRGVIC